jgi:hypothetical protein
MKTNLPQEKKITEEMVKIAFDPEQKTADRLRALDMLSEILEKQSRTDQAMEKLDIVLKALQSE